jgi:hypothetical protein
MLPIKLPFSTGGCDAGPVVQFRLGELHVWYDSEGEQPVWTHLHFGTCIAMRFTPEPSVSELMIQAYSRVIEHPESPWLSELRTQAKERHQQIFPDLRHMLVFFDHYGCLELVARTVSVDESSGPPPSCT